jgi:hypothetical protein
LKKPTKRAGRVAQGVDPEFKPQYCKRKSLDAKSGGWLTPMIPATQEVEIGRIKVRGQQGQKIMKTHLNQ